MCRKSISTYILRSTACSLLLVAWAAAAMGQAAQRQAAQGYQPRLSKAEQLRLRMKAADDSIPVWRGLQVKVDLVGPLQKAVSSYGQYEAGIRVNLKDKYFPVVELGYGTADENNAVTMISYKTSAPYGKIGAEFNLMRNKHDIYRLYGGFRYAYTSFKCDITHPDMTDPVWGGSTPFAGYGIKASCHWIEGVFGIDAKILGPVHLGWSVRYKRRIAYDNGEMGNVWYVPGYGKQGSSRLGGTFEIMFEI